MVRGCIVFVLQAHTENYVRPIFDEVIKELSLRSQSDGDFFARLVNLTTMGPGGNASLCAQLPSERDGPHTEPGVVYYVECSPTAAEAVSIVDQAIRFAGTTQIYQ